MAALLDTDVLVQLRDGDPWTSEQLVSLVPPLFVSAVTRVELENGASREPELALDQRKRLDVLFSEIATLGFGEAQIAKYRSIVAATGFSRRKTSDRMTAATALAADLPLATFNGRDFRDVPGLQLIEWSRPAA